MLLMCRFVCKNRGWASKARLSLLYLCWPHKTKGDEI